MPRPQRDEANRSYTRIASYIPSECYGTDSNGAILMSENRGQDGPGVEALGLLNCSTGHTSRRERCAAEPGFQPRRSQTCSPSSASDSGGFRQRKPEAYPEFVNSWY
jgi:hypothetical protein